MRFNDAYKLVMQRVKKTELTLPVDEVERFHYLREVSGDICGLSQIDKRHLTTVFFIVCDELGLDEGFKNLWFTNGVGEDD